MEVNAFSTAREQLVARREKLEAAIGARGAQPDLAGLLADVDAALERLTMGTYGLCETCRDPIEPERLVADPLARFCLDHLTSPERRALEQDLQLAARVQRGLLPDADGTFDGWRVAYHYRPAGLVSGDYCDLVAADGDLYLMLGDVSGKGVAASTLMAHLHAMLRALISVHLPLAELMQRASRVFCESTLPMHYATLVCARAARDGEVELVNAGHVPAVLVHGTGTRLFGATGLPLGLFADQRFDVERVRLMPGDLLALCSDGVTECEGGGSVPYGIERLRDAVCAHRSGSPHAIVDACVRDLTAYRAGALEDDVTLMVIRRP